MTNAGEVLWDTNFSNSDSNGNGISDLSEIFLPIPNIKANNSDGPVFISAGAGVSITLSLSAGAYSARNADWWLVEVNPSGTITCFDLDTNSMLEGLFPTYQGTLFGFVTTQLLTFLDPIVGTYTFYFGVDLHMNGIADVPVYYDSVEVNIVP